MSDYRRARTKGGTYFFTVVTFQRQRFLIRKNARMVLRQAVESVRNYYPFDIDAWVLLPDHLHCIWTLPQNDDDFSKRWGLIKAQFSKQTGNLLHRTERLSKSRYRHRESTVWQRRFWEHQIRSEDDYQKHINYIHYNPVKHDLVASVCDWPYSTFHRYVRDGLYPLNWGSDIKLRGDDGLFGE